MNVLFLTLLDFKSIEERGIYTDLLRQMLKREHKVYVVSPIERRNNEKTHLISFDTYKILKLKIGNIQKTNPLEKGISTLVLEKQIQKGIEKYFKDIKFDLIVYSTPPITWVKAIRFIKKRDGAKSYLLLKDIFPQNAVDMGLLKKTGVTSPLYKYFRGKERQLYFCSDYIGCMSDANMDFILKNNPELLPDRVEVCPNSIEPKPSEQSESEVKEIKRKYNIRKDRITFVYGGNLGKPQGINFLIDCLRMNKNNERAQFIIVGSGTEYSKIEAYINEEHTSNVLLLKYLPKAEYDYLLNVCDVGLIFLDRNFTIPNFPSRMLSYMEHSIPILAATDVNTDIGGVIQTGGFGLWCESRDAIEFTQMINYMCDNNEKRKEMGHQAFKYLINHYTVKQSCDIILNHFEEEKSENV